MKLIALLSTFALASSCFQDVTFTANDNEWECKCVQRIVTENPTMGPTNLPSDVPSGAPTQTPTLTKSDYPSLRPTLRPSVRPTVLPTTEINKQLEELEDWITENTLCNGTVTYSP